MEAPRASSYFRLTKNFHQAGVTEGRIGVLRKHELLLLKAFKLRLNEGVMREGFKHQMGSE